jgi:hypothetical protein
MQSMKCGGIRNTREDSYASQIGARVHGAAFGAWARGAGAGGEWVNECNRLLTTLEPRRCGRCRWFIMAATEEAHF